ncbi:Na+/H+ antiporter subunit D [Haloechinothrix halophila]|uniref:Na+/H+ antiporter subunit D n=1 Tax=Haloechinothrix halophila TaxID=1069073 RepID=UPI0003F7A997|nr:Na+/H+ antiporter subunit D [Haloechinothrix halophila]
MTGLLVAVPALLPLLAAGVSLLVSRVRHAQRVVSGVALGAVLVDAAVLLVVVDANGTVVLRLGGYPPPAGITLVADRLSALMVLVSAVVTIAVLLYALGQRVADHGPTVTTSFHPVYLVLSAGVMLAYLTGDLFTLFVAFELMLTASYVLITRGVTADRVRAAMTYVITGLTSTLLFITLIALVYAATGTVNFADLGEKLADVDPGMRGALSLLFLTVIGIKAAIVPLHFWLPDSYPTAPAPVTAVFAGLLTKVGVYALIRVQTAVFAHHDVWHVLLVAALVTMLLGALGAVAQDDVNRMLSFLLVSHIGYMLFGLGLFSKAGLTGAILYALHHITVQAGLFLVLGLVARHTGATSLRRMPGGVARQRPLLATLFAIGAVNLAGLPPLSGFLAKVTLLRGGAASDDELGVVLAGAAVVVSFVTLYALARVWVIAFWGGAREGDADAERSDAELSPVMTTACTLLIGAGVAMAAFAGPLSAVADRAATHVLDVTSYRSAVLGGQR